MDEEVYASRGAERLQPGTRKSVDFMKAAGETREAWEVFFLRSSLHFNNGLVVAGRVLNPGTLTAAPVDDDTSSVVAEFRHRFQVKCGIRCKPITDSSRTRSAIPAQADHRFRSKPITDSETKPIRFRFAAESSRFGLIR